MDVIYGSILKYIFLVNQRIYFFNFSDINLGTTIFFHLKSTCTKAIILP